MALADSDYEGGSETYGGDEYYGGSELERWANARGVFLFWIAAISVTITVLIFLLWTMGNVQFGRSVVSYYASSVSPSGMDRLQKSRFGNNPNWRMGFGDAGYGSSVDIPGTEMSLGFNTEADCPVHGATNVSTYRNKSNFVDHMTPLPGKGKSKFGVSVAAGRPGLPSRFSNGVDHLDPNNPAEVAAAAAAARAEREARQKLYEDQMIKTCSDPWDPMATEEARVLSSVGTYRSAAGLGPFNRAINTNCTATLTDAQLEAIMQGQDSFTVEHLSGQMSSGRLSDDAQRKQSMILDRTTVPGGGVPVSFA